MTRQTWTALVAAVVFLALSVGLILIPVPYVSWTPGSTTDALGRVNGREVVEVDGTQTYPTSGQIALTTLSETRPDSHISLPEALLSYFMESRDVLPRDIVQPPEKSAQEQLGEQRVMMETSQVNAVVAALRAVGERVVQRPAVSSITVGSPAYNKLQPGDLILKVNGEDVTSNDQVEELIKAQSDGESLQFSVVRNKKPTLVRFAAGGDDELAGVDIADGYEYEPTISFDLGEQIGGPSAGLIFAVAIYDKITPGELTGGRRVAGTGSIDADGTVGSIGGIQQKVAAAEDSGAAVFLVPADNCDELADVDTDLSLVRVATLQEALSALEAIDLGKQEDIPRCQQ